MRKIILIGPIGYGKSSTGNSICEGDYFTSGEDTKRITTSIKFVQPNEHLLAIDCPGIGDPMDYTVFYSEFLKCREKFLRATPINGFIMLVKFDGDRSGAFLEACKQFVGAFGREGIKSLMLLCIQGNKKIRYSEDEFRDVVAASDGYTYLRNMHEEKKFPPYCLWDNFKPYYKQRENFESCFDHLHEFSQLMMKYSMELMQKEIDSHPQTQTKDEENY